MNQADVTVRAVAQGPMTAAPPSFNGMDWLFAINLAFFTAGSLILLMFAWWTFSHIWRNRKRDMFLAPVSIWRWSMLAIAIGFFLRCAAQAFNLWAWNPSAVQTTAFALGFQRFIDPIAFLFGLGGLGLATLGAPGIVVQLRKRPFPTDLWASLPMLKRPGLVILLSIGVAIGVTVTR